MTVDEFNDKWKNHLEEGFEGLEFSDAEGKVVDWLDKHFVLFELINPEFTYAQIKLKFGMARVYLQGLPITCAEIAEDAINKIMKCEL